ncbi:MAG: hypothetical protein JSW46_01135 [Gemmatimonadota bacterium]|nr:MAG: hypothetical protein JSW46_01135 [Gemmatimonadota bacterium]
MPPWPYVRAFILRVIIVWSALHVLSFSLLFTLRGFLLAAAATLTLVLLDAERRNERRLLANLGVSRPAIGAIVLLTVMSLEAIWRIAAGGLVD